MRIIFAGGGTAGHINPALAVAGYMKKKEPDTQILYVGAKGGMEEKLVAKAGFEFKPIKISGFKRSPSLKSLKHNIITLKRIVTSSSESKRIISEFKPDICIGTGGYVSGPVLRTAHKMGIPIIIHEQNAYPGITTKMLSNYARVTMLAMEDAKRYLNESANIVVTGNPVMEEVIFADKELSRKKLDLDSRPVILSFGGSLGARVINEAVAELIAETSKKNLFQHIHAYGQYGKWFPDLLKEKGVDISKHKDLDIREYIENMPACLAVADLVICRAGAITLSELQAQKKPAILIPSPNVAENHQYHNAMSMVNAEAADIIEEKDLTGETLIMKVNELISNPELLKERSNNLGKIAILDSNERIYKIIKQSV